MKLLFSATNGLNKWLKADLPRLPAEQGKQAGVNSLHTDAHTFSWQVHIIDNSYQSFDKTLIACEAHSRFVFFLPVERRMSLQELTQILQMQWQVALVDALESYRILSHGDIAHLLSDLSGVNFAVKWVKNTDLSINGHTADAGLWVTDTLREYNLPRLTPSLAAELALHLNTQFKRVNKRREQFIPVERLLGYCEKWAAKVRSKNMSSVQSKGEVINLNDYKNGRA